MVPSLAVPELSVTVLVFTGVVDQVMVTSLDVLIPQIDAIVELFLTLPKTVPTVKSDALLLVSVQAVATGFLLALDVAESAATGVPSTSPVAVP